MSDPPKADDKAGQFTPKQREKLIEILTAHFGGRKCDVCENQVWGLNNFAVSPLVLQVSRNPNLLTPDLGNSHPSAMLACKRCGNVKLFSLSELDFDLYEDPPE